VAPAGLTVAEVAKRAKVGKALTIKLLDQLAVELPAPIEKRGATWYSTGIDFTLDTTHFAELTARRHAEQDRIYEYALGKRCLMAYIADELDDKTAGDCGRCSVCRGTDLVPRSADPSLTLAASDFKDAAPKRRRRPKRPPQTTARVKRARRRK
jgi:ATP-dependent DNA helicase RecQ